MTSIVGPRPLVLASTSRYRARLLRDLGLEFEQVAPEVDERATKFDGLAPRELALTLARAKAAAVQAQRPDAVIMGSDQVCALGERRFDQPGTVERAIETLEALSGETHDLLTALVVLWPGGRAEHVDATRLSMLPHTRDELERYVARDEPLDCAGSYKLESVGVLLFDRIETQDASAIQGLPLMALGKVLRELGWQLP